VVVLVGAIGPGASLMQAHLYQAREISWVVHAKRLR